MCVKFHSLVHDTVGLMTLCYLICGCQHFGRSFCRLFRTWSWDSSSEIWKKPTITHRGTPNGNTRPWKPQISLLHVLKNSDTSAPSHYITSRHIPQHSSLANHCR